MSIKDGLQSILNNRLDSMRDHFSNALTTKAVDRLEERKVEIASNYFGRSVNEKD